MAKQTEELPPFTVDGEYEDHEWREIAANPDRPKRLETRYREGPKIHPYGTNAYRDEPVDGPARWFPDRDAREKYVNQYEAAKPQRAEPSPTEPVGPEHAKATRRGIDSTPKGKVVG